MRVFSLLVLLVSVGCGAKVVFGDGAAGEGGAGGVEPEVECVLGCGEACVKCQGDECFDGNCSEHGRCLPAGSDLECSE